MAIVQWIVMLVVLFKAYFESKGTNFRSRGTIHAPQRNTGTGAPTWLNSVAYAYLAQYLLLPSCHMNNLTFHEFPEIPDKSQISFCPM